MSTEDWQTCKCKKMYFFAYWSPGTLRYKSSLFPPTDTTFFVYFSRTHSEEEVLLMPVRSTSTILEIYKCKVLCLEPCPHVSNFMELCAYPRAPLLGNILSKSHTPCLFALPVQPSTTHYYPVLPSSTQQHPSLLTLPIPPTCVRRPAGCPRVARGRR